MNFQDFLKHVPRFLEVELEASDSHFKMAPFERIEFLKNLTLESKSPKIAAVMMLFYPKDSKTHIVLIVRNSYKGVHSAQIAFPGGKFETSDENYEKTALRETHEEIGIHPQSIEVIRAFTHLYIPPSNFIVYPFMGVCKNEVTFIPDSSEVAEIIELPLAVFLNDEIIVNTNISTSYAENISIPAFKINNHMVWGATAMMLSELKDMLKKVL